MRLRQLLLAILLVLVTLSLAEACPTCKVALGTHDKAQGDLVSAYMYSILFMMAMPFVLLGSFCTYLYVQVRRARQQGEQTPRADVTHDEPVSV